MADENEEVRIKDLTELKYKGFLPLDDDDGTGKFPIESFIKSVAPVFESSASYSANQSVMYQGKLYTFKVSHTGEWNPADVFEDVTTQASGFVKPFDSTKTYMASEIVSVSGRFYRFNIPISAQSWATAKNYVTEIQLNDVVYSNSPVHVIDKLYKFDRSFTRLPHSVDHTTDTTITSFIVDNCVDGSVKLNVTTTASKVVVVLWRVNNITGNVPSSDYRQTVYDSRGSGTFDIEIDIRKLCDVNSNLSKLTETTHLKFFINAYGSGTTTINSCSVSKDIKDFYDAYDGDYAVSSWVSSSGQVRHPGKAITVSSASNIEYLYLGHVTSGLVRFHIKSTQRVIVLYMAKNWMSGGYNSSTLVYRSAGGANDIIVEVDLLQYADKLIHPYMGAEIIIQTDLAATVTIESVSFSDELMAKKCELWATRNGYAYSVGSSEIDHFHSFSEAMISLSCEFFPTIIVKDGTYDITSEMSEYLDDTQELSWWRYGLSIPAGAKILFSPRSKLVCNYTGNNALTRSSFSILNHDKMPFGFRIEGMNAEAKNIRYVVHDDFHSAAFPVVDEFVNCNLKIDGTENSDWVYARCIGGGLGTNMRVFIASCVFESLFAQGTNAHSPVSYHNSEEAGKNIVTIKDCYIKGEQNIDISSYGESTEKSLLIASGNSLGMALVYPSPSDNVEYIAWNNEVRS